MLLSCFLLFIEFLCVYIFLKSFLQLSYLPTKNDIITLLLLLLISCFLPEKNDLFVFIVGQFFYFFYIVVIYAENVSNGLCLYCLSVGGMVLCQIFAAQTLKVALIPADSKLAFILGDIATLIFSITICCMKILRNLYFKIRNSGIVNRLIIINTYVLSIMCILFFKLHPGYLYYNLANILIFAIILIITNFCVIYYDQQLLIQKQEIQSYQKNLPIYESLIQEIRENQHEYSNRLQSLQILSETCTDYTSLKEALGKYTKDCAKPLYSYPLLQIDKPLLAATLYNLAYLLSGTFLLSQGVSLCHDVFKLIISLPTRLVKMLTFYWTIFTFIIKTDTFTNSLTDIHSSDDVITLLVHLGYLSFDLETKQAFIPNKEGHDRFKSAVRIA